MAVLLHGFGDDALGSAPRLLDLPDMDAVCFTFRGRDLVPEALITLGGLERAEVVRVVAFLESNGWARDRQVLVGTSQGAGVAILALADLEKNGKPLGGALLESPFLDLRSAAKHHLRGSLGWIEPLARPAERLGIWRAGRIAGFKADDVSPSRAIRELRTPLAIISGTGDWITPIEDVRTLAGPNGDLTVIPGAGHLEASQQVAGGWTAWAKPRLDAWGFVRP